VAGLPDGIFKKTKNADFGQVWSVLQWKALWKNFSFCIIPVKKRFISS
jgi:hypothetical protein